MRPWSFSTVSARATSGGGSSQGGSVAEGDGDVAMQLRLVRLDDEQVVALGVTHMAADLALGEDRVAGDDRALERQSLQERQRRRDLVRLGRHGEVADHCPEFGREGREYMQRRAIAPAAAAQRLAVERDVPVRRLAAGVAPERRRQGIRVESLEEIVIAGVAG